MTCGYNAHTCNHVEQECVRTKFRNKLNILESTYELPASAAKESHGKIDDVLDTKTKCDNLLKEYKEL